MLINVSKDSPISPELGTGGDLHLIIPIMTFMYIFTFNFLNSPQKYILLISIFRSEDWGANIKQPDHL